MGIRFNCPHCGGRLNVKAFLAGKRGFCPKCHGRIVIPLESQIAAAQPTAMAALVATQSWSDRVVRQPDSQSPARPLPQAGGRSADGPLSQLGAGPSLPPLAVEPTRPLPAGQAGVAQAVAPDAAGAAPAGASPAFPAAAVLSEAPHAVWFVRSLQGQEFGPASAEQMEIWLREGRVWPTMYVWREGWPMWKLASEVFPPATWSAARLGTALGGGGAAHPPAQTVARALAQYQRRRRFRQSWWVVSVVVLTILAIVLTVALVIVLRR